ncbi:MAG: hypothetical protein D8M59_13410 [Planctomycetes bacterium]|nr:hypothetical protein [Planctomycetota bacterium]
MLFSGIASASVLAADYQLIPLGDEPTGDFRSRGFGINNNGDVVGLGNRDTAQSQIGTRWLWDGSNYTIDVLDGLEGIESSRAQDINDSGQIAGFWVDGQAQAFAWDAGGGLNSFLNGPDVPFSRVRRITNSGKVLGWLEEDGSIFSYQGYIYDLGTSTLTKYGTLGGDVSIVHAMNASGLVVGSASSIPNDGGIRQAVTWSGDPSTPTPLGGLGAFAGYEETRATRITDSGIILGSAGNRDLDNVLFAQNEVWMWDPNTQTATSTGFLDGYEWIKMGGANDDASVLVGHAYREGENGNAFINEHVGVIWTEGTGWVDINTMLAPEWADYTVLQLNGMNENGWLVGDALNPDGDVEAVVLVPTPSSLALVGFGTLLMARRRRRS